MAEQQRQCWADRSDLGEESALPQEIQRVLGLMQNYGTACHAIRDGGDAWQLRTDSETARLMVEHGLASIAR